MYRSCLFHKCHPREGQNYPPGPYLYQLWKKKLWKERFQKFTSLTMWKKGERNPVYYITCRALWPALTSLHVILMRGRCFYYHLHKAKPRLRGQWVQTAKVELGVVPCLHPGLSWFHCCTCRFPESEDKSYGSFLSCTIKRKKLWNAAMFDWKAGLCLLPCQQWQSVFPCVVQRVNLNPLKCQEPHLLLHLKREYFALFFFFKSWFGLSVFVLQPSAQMPITRKMY